MIELLKESRSAISDLIQSIEVDPTDISVWYDLSAVDVLGNAKSCLTKLNDEISKHEQ